MEDLEQDVRAPCGAEASVLDAALDLCGADEIEGSASDDGHVLGSVALSVSGEVVLELDVEDPVHGLDAPVASDGVGDAVDIEGQGCEIEAGFVADLAGLFGGSVDLNQGLDARKARLSWVSAVGDDPVDVCGGPIEAGLYAAMALFDGGVSISGEN